MFGERNAVELVFLAALALIVIGPKDLPLVMRKVGQFTAKMRGLAAEFRASFEELARQSELDELRKEVDALRQGQLGMAEHQVEIEREFDELQHNLYAHPDPDGYTPAYMPSEADDDQPDLPFQAGSAVASVADLPEPSASDEWPAAQPAPAAAVGVPAFDTPETDATGAERAYAREVSA